MDHTAQLQQEIAEHRLAVSARRARAFIDCPDSVLGLNVLPVTARTWTMLQAIGSRLLTGETPLEGDIRNYIWLHSPFQPVAARWPSLAGLLKWCALLRFNMILHRQRDSDWHAATLATAANEIAGILSDALSDAPRGERACAPGPCLEAQLIHYCATAYHWPAERASTTPLRQLMQLVRAAAPADTDDEGERQIRFNHLRRRNAELAAARA